MPSQYVNLMPKDQDLGCQRGPRSEQQYQRRPDQAASFSHKIETLRDSASLASRIRFPTGTSVVGAIEPKLLRAEIERARRKPTENLDAYDYYLRGLAKARWSKDANIEALQLFYKAIELDPGLASAYGMAASCYSRRKAHGWMNDRVKESAEAGRLARKAVHLGGDNPIALCAGGFALAFVAHEFDDAAALFDC